MMGEYLIACICQAEHLVSHDSLALFEQAKIRVLPFPKAVAMICMDCWRIITCVFCVWRFFLPLSCGLCFFRAFDRLFTHIHKHYFDDRVAGLERILARQAEPA